MVHSVRFSACRLQEDLTCLHHYLGANLARFDRIVNRCLYLQAAAFLHNSGGDCDYLRHDSGRAAPACTALVQATSFAVFGSKPTGLIRPVATGFRFAPEEQLASSALLSRPGDVGCVKLLTAGLLYPRDGSFQQRGPAPAGHRRRPPAVLSTCCLGNKPKTYAAAKQRTAKTCLNAFQYDVFQPPEPAPKPLTVFKYWLYSKLPILRNEELVSRTAWTLMVVAAVRFGQQLKLPYVAASVQSDASCRLLHSLSVTSVSVQILRIP